MKESPAEAEIISHKLLLRAGLVRKLTGGLYTFLPAGLRALKKLNRLCAKKWIAREHWRCSCRPCSRPILGKVDDWRARDVLFHVKDRDRKTGCWARPTRR